MLVGLEPTRLRLRTELLVPLCIQHRIGAASWSRTKQAPFETTGLQPVRGPSPSNATFWCLGQGIAPVSRALQAHANLSQLPRQTQSRSNLAL